ncbi:MAG TPA: hypothetical protein VFE62_17360, partial [Gemmataceae bacterium]|nr:hypothetical protein [Gemmataceae bacterium]
MRSNLLARPLPALLVLSLVASARSQTILYNSNGFEAPTFTAGSPLIGQDDNNPWQSAGGSPTAYVVESSTVASGAQAVQANGGGLNDASFAFPGIFYAPGPDERVDIQVDMARTLS